MNTVTEGRVVVTIDIMLPYYGDPAQLREAVESIRAQHDDDWRLVVIDDRYPHWDAKDWVTGLGDPRIEFQRNDKNLGVSGSFNRSIDLAREEYLTIMGGDDRMLPDYVGTVKRAIETFDRPSLIQPGVRVIDGEGDPSYPLVDRVKTWVRPSVPSGGALLRGEDVMVTLLRGDWSYFPSICWRRDVLAAHRFDPAFEITLDLVIKTAILTEGGSLALLPDVVFEYRRHDESASSYTAKDGSRFDEERAFYRRAAAQMRELGWRRAERAARRRLTSRLHAASKLPAALVHRDRVAISALSKHATAR